jgi:hypothetical protein
MAQGIESKAGPGNVVDDYDAICRVVQLSQEGEATGNGAKLKEAWHANARIFAGNPWGRDGVPIAQAIAEREGAPVDHGTYRWRILSVQQTGDAAVAVTAEDGYQGPNSVVSYLSLARIDSLWKIVGAVVMFTPGVRPAGSQ